MTPPAAGGAGTVAQALAQGAAALRAAGIEGAPRDARALLAGAMGLAPERLVVMGPDPVDPEAATRFDAFLARRIAREPVSKILGRRLFWGRAFTVTRDVLDPRPETESLVALALEGGAAARLLDLGTGSGILALTLLAEWPGARALATDISPAALEVARRNAAALGVEGRLQLCRADWFDGLPGGAGGFDLIVSNPPYIAAGEMPGLSPEVRLHDPPGALSPGGDGLDPYRRIAAGAAAHLAPGGRLLVEIGWQQGPAVAGIFRAAGLAQVRVHPDMDGRDRVVSAILPETGR